MSGSKSRRKGACFERSVCVQLREAGYDAKRNLEEVRSGNSGDIVIDAPFSFQLKCYAKQAPIRRAYREARESAGPGEYAVAVTKENNAIPLVHLSLADFLELIGMLRSEEIL